MKPSGVLVMIVAMLCACGTSVSGLDNRPVKTVGGNEDLVILESDLPAVREQALRGSGEAAKKLSSYYEFVKMDHAAGLYWTTIGAENGDVIEMYNAGVFLTREEGHENTIRARFWFQRAKAAGVAEAEEQLRKLDTKER
jgi:TPR repeat protein